MGLPHISLVLPLVWFSFRKCLVTAVNHGLLSMLIQKGNKPRKCQQAAPSASSGWMSVKPTAG